MRWELNIRGGKDVKIIVSGRLSEENLVQLQDLVDGFGVGTAVAYPPVIDFSAKIVEVDDKGKRSFRAKRGGLGGRKEVFRRRGFEDTVALTGTSAPKGFRNAPEADNERGQDNLRLQIAGRASGSGAEGHTDNQEFRA